MRIAPALSPQFPAQRSVINADALEWLRLNPAKPFTSVLTSLPDVSELNLAFDEWRSWFIDSAFAFCKIDSCTEGRVKSADAVTTV